MALTDDLKKDVAAIFRAKWVETEATSVPEPEDIILGGNHASTLAEATVLYADLDGSTSMVDTKKWEFSAEIYKTFLLCAARIIASENGAITAYDGDRIMAIFFGGTDQNTRAVRCALKINHAVHSIVNPAILAKYNTDFQVKHVVGIDRTTLRAARTGVRGHNDLVWIGKAANYAAKLTNISLAQTTWITPTIYNQMHDSVKFSGDGQNMWKQFKWSQMNDIEIWGSAYHWNWTGW